MTPPGGDAFGAVEAAPYRDHRGYGSRRPRAALLGLGIGEDCRQVLRFGEQADDVDVIGSRRSRTSRRGSRRPAEHTAREPRTARRRVGTPAPGIRPIVRAQRPPRRRTVYRLVRRPRPGSTPSARRDPPRPAGADAVDITRHRTPAAQLGDTSSGATGSAGLRGRLRSGRGAVASRLCPAGRAGSDRGGTRWCCRSRPNGHGRRCSHATTPARRSSSCSDSRGQSATRYQQLSTIRRHATPAPPNNSTPTPARWPANSVKARSAS